MTNETNNSESKLSLAEYYNQTKFYTGKISDTIRQLNFAGIAAIWIFCKIEKGIILVPFLLKMAIAGFIFSFLFELAQYSIQAYNTHKQAEYLRINNISESSHELSWVKLSYRLFRFKLGSCICGWLLVLLYLVFPYTYKSENEDKLNKMTERKWAVKIEFSKQ